MNPRFLLPFLLLISMWAPACAQQNTEPLLYLTTTEKMERYEVDSLLTAHNLSEHGFNPLRVEPVLPYARNQAVRFTFLVV